MGLYWVAPGHDFLRDKHKFPNYSDREIAMTIMSSLGGSAATEFRVPGWSPSAGDAATIYD